MKQSRTRLRRPTRGVMLLDVLTALVVFSIGVVGLMALHVTMTRAIAGSHYRMTAALLADDLIGIMWANVPKLGNMDTAEDCEKKPLCKHWKEKVQVLLPNGRSDIDLRSKAGHVVISIYWTVPGEGKQTYSTAAYVKR
ncbi:hypothetical protein ACG0Z6_06165 [Roseateles sp. BYS180W]|uniref:Type IV pilus modification protein PilV n=1 Tax=Roseateles rivi TaxID=3299028 RepID=A0ABW7FU33_9BURK